MIKKLFKSGSVEWLHARCQYVTGTDVSSLLGFNKYKSAAKVLKEKIEPPVKIDNAYMRAGRILEPGVLIAVSEIGILTKPAAQDGYVAMCIDEESRLSASLDGIAVIKGKEYILEAKTTSTDKFEAWETAPPINYLLQVQTQLIVTGTTTAVLACLESNFPFKLIIYKVDSNEKVQELIKSESVRFWKYYAENRKFVVNSSIKDKINKIILDTVVRVY